jgi:hypothetical protein
MQKIISLFQRNYEGDRQVRDEVTPGAEWVLAGEGVGTRKWDGTCCRIKDGVLYKRYDAKNGKTPPPGFEAAQDPDPITGHWPGWLPVGEGKEDKWFRKAVEGYGELSAEFEDGTYELVGPAINGNPEGWESHNLVKHGIHVLSAPRTFAELKDWFKDQDVEGIVWHHPDGRMVKIKKKDFGLKR